MFPDLSYLFNYFFGTPVDGFLSIFKTFGLFLVLAFIASSQLLKLELKRKEEENLIKGQKRIEKSGGGASITEIIINGIFGLILGMKIPVILSDFSAFSQDPSGTILSSKGNILLGIIGAVILGGLTYYFGNKKKGEATTQEFTIMPHQRVMDITMVAAISGILGAKLFSIFENMDAFLQAPIQTLFSGSGLTIYGGLILGFISVYIYIKRMGINPIHVMDAVAPALIIGYAVGRLGCQFSGDGDWGIVNNNPVPNWFFLPDWMWSFDYPHNVVNHPSTGIPMEDCGGVVAVGGKAPIYCTKLPDPVYPTPIYESILGTLIFAFLWLIRKRVKIAGMLFFIYVLLNGIERFFIEAIRVNPRYDLFNLNWSMSQWIAIVLVIIGLSGIGYLYSNGKRLDDMRIKTS